MNRIQVKQWWVDVGLIAVGIFALLLAKDMITVGFIFIASFAIGLARWWAGRNEQKQKHKTS